MRKLYLQQSPKGQLVRRDSEDTSSFNQNFLHNSLGAKFICLHSFKQLIGAWLGPCLQTIACSPSFIRTLQRDKNLWGGWLEVTTWQKREGIPAKKPPEICDSEISQCEKIQTDVVIFQFWSCQFVLSIRSLFYMVVTNILNRYRCFFQSCLSSNLLMLQKYHGLCLIIYMVRFTTFPSTVVPENPSFFRWKRLKDWMILARRKSQLH